MVPWSARFERHFLKLKIEVARWVFQLPLADDENDVHEILYIFSLTYKRCICFYGPGNKVTLTMISPEVLASS